MCRHLADRAAEKDVESRTDRLADRRVWLRTDRLEERVANVIRLMCSLILVDRREKLEPMAQLAKSETDRAISAFPLRLR